MEESAKNLWQSLGVLRLALMTLALLNMLLPVINMQLGDTTPGYHGLWHITATIVAPVMAPLFAVVLLFDYIMTRVRAADAEGEERALFTRIGRVELAVMLATSIFWVPFFVNLLG